MFFQPFHGKETGCGRSFVVYDAAASEHAVIFCQSERICIPAGSFGDHVQVTDDAQELAGTGFEPAGLIVDDSCRKAVCFSFHKEIIESLFGVFAIGRAGLRVSAGALDGNKL